MDGQQWMDNNKLATKQLAVKSPGASRQPSVMVANNLSTNPSNNSNLSHFLFEEKGRILGQSNLRYRI